jgi:hypothetical protein
MAPVFVLRVESIKKTWGILALHIPVEVIQQDLGLMQLPLVSGLGFGHTSPSLVLPMGVEIEIDCEQKQLSIPEGCLGRVRRELSPHLTRPRHQP